MIIALANLLMLMRGSLRGVDSSRQLAAGVVLGMLIGLTPKISLMVIFFGLILIVSKANLITGILSALFFTWISPLLDPVSHNLGVMLLTHESLQPFFCEITQSPLVAWTRIENTVVTGSVIIGLFLILPVHHISYRLFARYRDLLVEAITQNRISKWIMGPPAEIQES